VPIIENTVFQGKSRALSESVRNSFISLQRISTTPLRGRYQHGLLISLYIPKAPEEFSLRYSIFDEAKPASLISHVEYRFVTRIILREPMVPFRAHSINPFITSTR